MPFKILLSLKDEEGEIVKKDTLLNFKVDEDFKNWLAGQVADLDCSQSEFIRAAVLLSAPLIKQCPPLLKIITLQMVSPQ